MREEEAYLRYLKFKEVELPAVPENQWHLYYRDLLRYERCLVWGDSIGLVPEYPFEFQVTDPQPFRQRPIMYSKRERDWLREYM